MVIDTSAIVAILFAEADAELFARAIASDPMRLISAGTALECSLVVESELGEEGGRELDLLLLRAGIETIPFTPNNSPLRVRPFGFSARVGIRLGSITATVSASR